MKMTSAQANKKLKQLNDEYSQLLVQERQSSTFNAAVGEDIESVRPEYDYKAVQRSLEDIAAKIRKLKFTINTFNISTSVPGIGISIVEALVLIPQLSERKRKLEGMKARLPKMRVPSFNGHSNIIDYTIINYDIKEVAADYEAVSEQLAKVQTALDVVNNTVEFEVDI